MAEWPRIMEGNIAHTSMGRKHLIECYTGNLQCSIVLSVRSVAQGGDDEKGRQSIGPQFGASNQKFRM